MKYVGSNLNCYTYILCTERGEEVKAGKRDKKRKKGERSEKVEAVKRDKKRKKGERGEKVKAGKRDKRNVRKVRGVRKGRRKERKSVRRINKCLHIYGF